MINCQKQRETMFFFCCTSHSGKDKANNRQLVAGKLGDQVLYVLPLLATHPGLQAAVEQGHVVREYLQLLLRAYKMRKRITNPTSSWSGFTKADISSWNFFCSCLVLFVLSIQSSKAIFIKSRCWHQWNTHSLYAVDLAPRLAL